MRKTAIVIGATGLVGNALVNQLSHQSHIGKVVAVTRRPMQFDSPLISNEVVDYERLENFAAVFGGDLLFSCLGTTRKLAGSVEAQRRVDLDYQYESARLAERGGVRHYLLVSSTGASAKSTNAYLKMKGEIEEKVGMLGFERLSIFRPSLLLGERSESRPGEKIAGFFLPALSVLPGIRRYRPIRGAEVAAKMIQVTREPGQSRELFDCDECFPS